MKKPRILTAMVLVMSILLSLGGCGDGQSGDKERRVQKKESVQQADDSKKGDKKDDAEEEDLTFEITGEGEGYKDLVIIESYLRKKKYGDAEAFVVLKNSGKKTLSVDVVRRTTFNGKDAEINAWSIRSIEPGSTTFVESYFDLKTTSNRSLHFKTSESEWEDYDKTTAMSGTVEKNGDKYELTVTYGGEKAGAGVVVKTLIIFKKDGKMVDMRSVIPLNLDRSYFYKDESKTYEIEVSKDDPLPEYDSYELVFDANVY